MANKTPTNYSQWFVNECARVAREGWKAMCQVPGEYFLYYKPRGLELRIALDKPDGFELATGEHVPGNLTVEQMTGWVSQRSSRLEILPGD